MLTAKALVKLKFFKLLFLIHITHYKNNPLSDADKQCSLNYERVKLRILFIILLSGCLIESCELLKEANNLHPNVREISKDKTTPAFLFFYTS